MISSRPTIFSISLASFQVLFFVLLVISSRSLSLVSAGWVLLEWLNSNGTSVAITNYGATVYAEYNTSGSPLFQSPLYSPPYLNFGGTSVPPSNNFMTDRSVLRVSVNDAVGELRIGVFASGRGDIQPELVWLEHLANRALRNGGWTVMEQPINVSIIVQKQYALPGFVTPTQQIYDWLASRTAAVAAAGAVDVFIGAVSDRTLSIAAAAEPFQIPTLAPVCPIVQFFQCDATLAPPCTKPNTRRFQYLHGIMNVGPQYWPSYINLLKLNKATSLAIIFEEYGDFYEVACSAVIPSLSDYEIDLLYYGAATVDTTFATPHPNNTILLEQIEILQQMDPDAVLICGGGCSWWVNAMVTADYTAKAMAFTNCVDFPDGASLGDRAKFLVGASQWHPRLSGQEYTESQSQEFSIFPEAKGTGDETGFSFKPSPAQFAASWQLRFNQTADYKQAAYVGMYEMLEGSILIANTTNRIQLNHQLQQFYDQSFFGTLSTSRYGFNQQKDMVLVQRDQNNVQQLIGPLFSATMDFIYPMPRWDERVYIQHMYGSTGEHILIILMSICCVYLSLLAWLMFHYREVVGVKAQSVSFSVLALIGCALSITSILTWPYENNSTTCQLRIWTWTIGFHLFIDPIVAKARRISIIFNNKLTVSVVRDADVFSFVLKLLIPQILLNCVWSAAYPLVPALVTFDVLRPANSFTECSISPGGSSPTMILISLTLFWGGTTLFYACYLSVRIRDAYTLFNDSKPIAASVYVFALGSTIILALQLGLNSPANAATLFVLRSAIVLVSYITSVSLLFAPCVWQAYRALNFVQPLKVPRPKPVLHTPPIGMSVANPSEMPRGDGDGNMFTQNNLMERQKKSEVRSRNSKTQNNVLNTPAGGSALNTARDRDGGLEPPGYRPRSPNHLPVASKRCVNGGANLNGERSPTGSLNSPQADLGGGSGSGPAAGRDKYLLRASTAAIPAANNLDPASSSVTNVITPRSERGDRESIKTSPRNPVRTMPSGPADSDAIRDGQPSPPHTETEGTVIVSVAAVSLAAGNVAASTEVGSIMASVPPSIGSSSSSTSSASPRQFPPAGILQPLRQGTSTGMDRFTSSTRNREPLPGMASTESMTGSQKHLLYVGSEEIEMKREAEQEMERERWNQVNVQLTSLKGGGSDFGTSSSSNSVVRSAPVNSEPRFDTSGGIPASFADDQSFGDDDDAEPRRALLNKPPGSTS